MNVSRDIPALLTECNGIITKSNKQLDILISKCQRLQNELEKLIPDHAARIASHSNPEVKKSLDALREKIHHCLADVNIYAKISSFALDLIKSMRREPPLLYRAINPTKYIYIDPASEKVLFNFQIDALKHFLEAHLNKLGSH